MKFHTHLTVLAAALFASGAAWACGDKLAAIGGGIRFERLYAARHPGTVALLIPQDSRFATASRNLQLVAALKRAGHTVNTYESRIELDQALQARDTDAVLIDVAESVAGLDATALGSAAIVWVVPDSKAVAMPAALNERCVLHIGRRSTPLLLRTVDEALEKRERGITPDCASATPAQGI